MQRKNTWVIVAIIVVAIVAIGGYAIFHKSSKPVATNSSSSTNNSVPAVNNAVVITKTNSAVGQYLADPSGRTLYTYGSDSSSVSNCTGSCLTAWPAYLITASSTSLPAGIGTIKRTDNGQLQYTYNSMPLYFFASDSQGQVTGNGVSGFTVAKPSASQSSTTAPSPSSPSNNSSGYPY